jgi:DNA-binding NtrC family response regulator
MAMRGSGPRARSPVAVDVRTFGWDRAVLSTLRHSTLALESFDATPISATRDIGNRDRLSLVGQFAAHQALLQFAGVVDDAFDEQEWAVVQKRGTDCRLVRLAGRRAPADPVPLLTIVQQFADAIETPAIEVLRQSSARAEAVYCEIDSRLREDAAADLRWFRAAAMGQIASPGIDVLRSLMTARHGRYRAEDREALATIRRAVEDVIVIGEQSSPFDRFSGLAGLESLVPELRTRDEGDVVERVIESASRRRLIFFVTAGDALDAASRQVVELLQASETGVWVGAEGEDLPESKWFVISPRLVARQELDMRLAEIPRDMRRAKLELFVESPCFGRYLADGFVPPPQLASPTGAIKEPARSYVAAVALLGRSASREVIDAFLEKLAVSATVEELLFDGVTSLDRGTFSFASEDLRQAAMQHLPASSRTALSRTAAETLEEAGLFEAAAVLYAESGCTARATEILERIEWPSAEAAVTLLRAVRKDVLSPRLTQTLAQALIDVGRYRDARDLAPGDESLLARIERRTGDYTSALGRLVGIDRSFRDDLLHAELLALTGRSGDAMAAYERCEPSSEDEIVLLGYYRDALAIDLYGRADRADTWMRVESPLRDHYAARFQTYAAISRHEAAQAVEHAAEAVATARTTAERIDATLDHLFALFTSGRWSDAREAALRGMLIVDETQGDRAAAGILFMLAYLCADEGQCAHAAHLLDRLRQFYTDVHDERRLHELHLIAAAIELSLGRFDAALVSAESVLEREVPSQIREAAALIADDVALTTKRDVSLRASGSTANVELTDRYRLLRGQSDAQRTFIRDLSAWRGGAPPAAETGSDKMLLFRTALRRNDDRLARTIAVELGVVLTDSSHADDAELRALRIASTHAFPFAASDFAPAHWRFVTRNRLGHWSEIGSLEPLSSSELDRRFEHPSGDWITCGDRELLYFEGVRGWSLDSRKAIAAAFRTRAEHFRLRRLIEHEDAPPVRTADLPEGIIGQSPVIHEICDLVARVARRDISVCILGESGTGKELIARAIHRQSLRHSKPFTTINCAALPENLIESEMFGSARGAYTGAARDRAGLIETTEGGTLFLDEIGEMPAAAQAKLLRFLQEGEFRRVGDTTLRSADVRIITATNRKLETAVESGRFREDLYYRIRGVEVLVPPLRDRAIDIEPLASHFLAREREKHRGGASRFSDDVLAVFASYHWPGNVRELQNAIRAAHAIAGDVNEIDLEHLPESLRRVKAVRKVIGSYQDAVVRFRRDLIEKSLAQAKGNQNQAAAMLKISRQALAYQIRELGILVTPPKRSPA